MPYNYNTNPQFTKGYVDFLGTEYANSKINQNVLTVSLFSESLTVDSIGDLKGIGQFLMLEDVFINTSDTLLPKGIFTINNSHQPFTVSPGRNDTVGAEIFQIGAYIAYYEPNASKSTKKLITEGTITVDKVNAK